MAVSLFGLGVAVAFLSEVMLFDAFGENALGDETVNSLETIGSIIGSTPVLGAIVIFFNNLLAGLIMFGFGAILSIVPVFALLLNGFLVGDVTSALLADGITLDFVLMGLLPHGIPELFAIFVFAGLGMKLGWHALKPFKGKTRKDSVMYILGEMKAVIVPMIVLLFIAAIIEVFVSKNLLLFFYS